MTSETPTLNCALTLGGLFLPLLERDVGAEVDPVRGASVFMRCRSRNCFTVRVFGLYGLPFLQIRVSCANLKKKDSGLQSCTLYMTFYKNISVPLNTDIDKILMAVSEYDIPGIAT